MVHILKPGKAMCHLKPSLLGQEVVFLNGTRISKEVQGTDVMRKDDYLEDHPI